MNKIKRSKKSPLVNYKKISNFQDSFFKETCLKSDLYEKIMNKTYNNKYNPKNNKNSSNNNKSFDNFSSYSKKNNIQKSKINQFIKNQKSLLNNNYNKNNITINKFNNNINSNKLRLYPLCLKKETKKYEKSDNNYKNNIIKNKTKKNTNNNNNNSLTKQKNTNYKNLKSNSCINNDKLKINVISKRKKQINKSCHSINQYLNEINYDDTILLIKILSERLIEWKKQQKQKSLNNKKRKIKNPEIFINSHIKIKSEIIKDNKTNLNIKYNENNNRKICIKNNNSFENEEDEESEFQTFGKK